MLCIYASLSPKQPYKFKSNVERKEKKVAPILCRKYPRQISDQHELKWLGYKSLENKVYNGNADRHLMIAAVAGTTVIKGLK